MWEVMRKLKSFAFQRDGQKTLWKGCGHTEQKLKTNAQKITYLLNNAVCLGDKVGARRKKYKSCPTAEQNFSLTFIF